MKLKIVAISDLHGYLPEIIEPADIMLLAGDIVPLRIQRNMPESKEWFETIFADWIEQLPVDHVFMVAGNHDWYFYNIVESNLSAFRVACKGKLTYLFNETRTYIDNNGLQWSIFGTCWCKEFCNWAFNLPNDKLVDKFKEIPSKVDIIISHDSPYAYGDIDIVMDNPAKLWEHLGNEPLAWRLFDVQYTLLVSGHIHSGDHQYNEYYKCANVSHLNEKYYDKYKPFYIEIEHDLV